jgi:hypothetical protein
VGVLDHGSRADAMGQQNVWAPSPGPQSIVSIPINPALRMF